MLVESSGPQLRHREGVTPTDCMSSLLNVHVWTAVPWPENDDSSHAFPCDEQKLLQLTPGVPRVHSEAAGGGCGGGRGGGEGWGGGGHSYPENPMSVMHVQVPQSTSVWAVAIREEKPAAKKTNTTAKSRDILPLHVCTLYLAEKEVKKGAVRGRESTGGGVQLVRTKRVRHLIT